MSAVTSRNSESFVINPPIKNGTGKAIKALHSLHMIGRSPMLEGEKNFTQLTRPAILALTHRSEREPVVDMVIFHRLSPDASSASTPRDVYVAAKDGLWSPKFLFLGKLLERYGAIPVDRRGEKGREDFVRLGRHVLAERAAHLAIYPEGTCGTGQEVARLKSGTALLALATGSPIVPIGQWGIHEKGMGASVVMRAPIHTEANPDLMMQNNEQLSEYVRRTARPARLLTEELRSELQLALYDAYNTSVGVPATEDYQPA